MQDKFFATVDSQELDFDVTDFNVGTLSRAFKFANRTRLKVSHSIYAISLTYNNNEYAPYIDMIIMVAGCGLCSPLPLCNYFPGRSCVFLQQNSVQVEARRVHDHDVPVRQYKFPDTGEPTRADAAGELQQYQCEHHR